jgi:hypothetical protein
MLDSVSSFVKKQLPPTLAYFTNKYELTESQAQGLLKWLIHEGLLHNINGKDSYVPTRDFSTTPIKEIIDTIEDQSRKIPTTPDDYTRTFITSIIKENKERNILAGGNLTFAAMITYLDMEDQKAAKIAASIIQ